MDDERDFFAAGLLTAGLVTILFCTGTCGLDAAGGAAGFAGPLLGVGACAAFLPTAADALAFTGDAGFVPAGFLTAAFCCGEGFLLAFAALALGAGFFGAGFLDSAPFKRPSNPEAPPLFAAAGFAELDFAGFLAAFLAVIVLGTR